MTTTSATIVGSATGITVDEALRIARLDGEKAYRDLSPYRIQISLEPDGWHIVYEFKNPQVQGGGPQYLIDAVTGAILSKKYYQ
jgi:hypothetical protein